MSSSADEESTKESKPNLNACRDEALAKLSEQGIDIPALKDEPSSTPKLADSQTEDEGSQEPANSTGKELPTIVESEVERLSRSKTVLNLDYCRDVAMQILENKHSRLKEQLSQVTPETTESISFKQATLCSAKWANVEPKDKVGFCNQCNSYVYDFSEMNLTDAEKLVFKMEARQNVTFYKRVDGKFLTVDCPVGLRVKRQGILVISTCVAVVAFFVVMNLLMPQPTRPTAIVQSADITKSSTDAGRSHATNATHSVPAAAPYHPPALEGHYLDLSSVQNTAAQPVLTQPDVAPIQMTPDYHPSSAGQVRH